MRVATLTDCPNHSPGPIYHGATLVGYWCPACNYWEDNLAERGCGCGGNGAEVIQAGSRTGWRCACGSFVRAIGRERLISGTSG